MVSLDRVKYVLKDTGDTLKCALTGKHDVSGEDLLRLVTKYRENPSATEVKSTCTRCDYPLILAIDSRNDKRYVVRHWRSRTPEKYERKDLSFFF